MNKNNISELRPGGATPTPTPNRDVTPPKRYSRRTKSHRSERTVRRLQFALVILIAVLVIGGLSFTMALQPLRGERNSLLQEVRTLERDLMLAREELVVVTAERDELVTTRIPGLKPLVFDETIAVDDDYLRNVLFTLTVRDGKPAYEFRVVLHNAELTEVVPDVTVLLFNELGIQVGFARVSLDTLAESTGIFKLSPGDVRSHSGQVVLSETGGARYYVINVE